MTPSEAMRVIGLNAGASQEDLKKRFHALAHIHHPDKGGNAENFKKISAAYQVLKSGIPAGNTASGFQSAYGNDFKQATSFDWETGEPIYDPPVTKKPPVRTEYRPRNPGNFGATDSQGHFNRKTASQRMQEMHAQMRQRQEMENLAREANEKMADLQAEFARRQAEIVAQWKKMTGTDL